MWWWRSTDRLRTHCVDEVKVDVEGDERYRQQSEEQFQNAGDRVNVATLVCERSRAIAVYQQCVTTTRIWFNYTQELHGLLTTNQKSLCPKVNRGGLNEVNRGVQGVWKKRKNNEHDKSRNRQVAEISAKTQRMILVEEKEVHIGSRNTNG